MQWLLDVVNVKKVNFKSPHQNFSMFVFFYLFFLKVSISSILFHTGDSFGLKVFRNQCEDLMIWTLVIIAICQYETTKEQYLKALRLKAKTEVRVCFSVLDFDIGLHSLYFSIKCWKLVGMFFKADWDQNYHSYQINWKSIVFFLLSKH